MLDTIPEWFRIFFLSMIPWLESRYVIPMAILSFNINWWQAMPIAITGNMLPVPLILLTFRFFEKFLKSYLKISKN